MIASLILGMGLPTTANYIVTSTIAAPALIALKAPVIGAHLFVFYFGIIADLTPPVALGAMAAAGLAQADFLKTGIKATRLAIVSFIVPYFFVYSPVLLMIDASVYEIVWVLTVAIIGIVLLGSALEGYMLTRVPIWGRPLFALGEVLPIEPGLQTDRIGLVNQACSLTTEWYRAKTVKQKVAMLVAAPTWALN